MRFNPRARINTGRVSDRGGSGGRLPGGGRPSRIPLPGGAKAGGGIAGLIIVILFIVLSSCLSGGLPTSLPDGGSQQEGGAGSDRYAECQTGEDANNNADCARKAVAVSIEDYWSKTLPEQDGTPFQPASMVTFSGRVDTGCGKATSQVGPFYCPPDQQIYLDTDFFDQVLEQQLDGPAGDFVEPYVLAHEYGHHIQNLRGTMGEVRTQQGPRSDAVRLELQADCFAGMWARSATTTTDEGGEPLITEITEQDQEDAIAAAAAVGDDRIQEKTQGQVTPESWTHGSAESRMMWYKTGLTKGTLKACDTWAVDTP